MRASNWTQDQDGTWWYLHPTVLLKNGGPRRVRGVIRICTQCGGEFPAVPSTPTKVCGHACRRELNAILMKGKKGWTQDETEQWWYFDAKGRRRAGVIASCEVCGRKKVRRQGRGLRLRFCSPTCYGKSQEGENNPVWKGGSVNPTSGYRMISHGGKQRLEHRIVMEATLGRPLLPFPLETVHHINGIRTDNRPENLELRSGAHGKGVHLCCADCGSSNIVPASLD